MTDEEQQDTWNEFARMDQRMKEVCKQVLTMTRTPAWQLVHALVKQRVLEVGDAALNDQGASARQPGYWLGFREGARGLDSILSQMQEAAEAVDAHERLDFSNQFNMGKGEPSTGGGHF